MPLTTILLVEDNPGDARLIIEHYREKATLVEDFEVVHVERVAAAAAILQQRSDIDMILSDITLPDSSGEDTLTVLNTAADDVPIIFMTGSNDEELAISAINKGAQDYLMKGRIDCEVLYRSTKYAIERKRVQNEMNKVIASDQLNRQRIKLLADQKKQLIKLNNSKDDFISIASHQLRTPATAVKQYVGMIVEGLAGDVSEQQRELLERAYQSNERQLMVINELLKTAQLDSSRIKLTFQKCSINRIIQECVIDIAPSIEMRQQSLNVQLDKDYELQVDHNELKLVVVNVLENASKYTPKGGCITVTTCKNDGKVNIVVGDEGVGISEDNIKVIFEKFSRIDNDLSDTVQGSGLGLYWARRIMKLHKGSIKVKSHLGEGSEFILSLPV